MRDEDSEKVDVYGVDLGQKLQVLVEDTSQGQVCKSVDQTHYVNQLSIWVSGKTCSQICSILCIYALIKHYNLKSIQLNTIILYSW